MLKKRIATFETVKLGEVRSKNGLQAVKHFNAIRNLNSNSDTQQNHRPQRYSLPLPRKFPVLVVPAFINLLRNVSATELS